MLGGPRQGRRTERGEGGRRQLRGDGGPQGRAVPLVLVLGGNGLPLLLCVLIYHLCPRATPHIRVHNYTHLLAYQG